MKKKFVRIYVTDLHRLPESTTCILIFNISMDAIHKNAYQTSLHISITSKKYLKI